MRDTPNPCPTPHSIHCPPPPARREPALALQQNGELLLLAAIRAPPALGTVCGGLNPPIPGLAAPAHVPALCPWLSTLQEQADDGLQALEFHTELVLHVEAAGFAPPQGQITRQPRAQQVPDLGIWQREGTGGAGHRVPAGPDWAAEQALTCSL